MKNLIEDKKKKQYTKHLDQNKWCKILEWRMHMIFVSATNSQYRSKQNKQTGILPLMGWDRRFNEAIQTTIAEEFTGDLARGWQFGSPNPFFSIQQWLFSKLSRFRILENKNIGSLWMEKTRFLLRVNIWWADFATRLCIIAC